MNKESEYLKTICLITNFRKLSSPTFLVSFIALASPVKKILDKNSKQTRSKQDFNKNNFQKRKKESAKIYFSLFQTSHSIKISSIFRRH